MGKGSTGLGYQCNSTEVRKVYSLACVCLVYIGFRLMG